MLLSGYVTGNGCIVMERRIWYNQLNTKDRENAKQKQRIAQKI